MKMRLHRDKLKALLRVPSFRVAYSVSLFVALAVLSWAFVDAWFRYTIHVAWGVVGLGRPYTDSFAAAWNLFGDRLLILASMVVAAPVATIIVALRLFFGSKADRSVLSYLLATLLIGVWTGVLIGIVRYPEAQVRYRLKRDMWRFQTVAQIIATEGKIPTSVETPFGEISGEVNTRFPTNFFPYKRRSIHEEVFQIWTDDDGMLLFTAWPSRSVLEFHPRGTRPRKHFLIYKMNFSNGPLQSAEELGDGWFLVER